MAFLTYGQGLKLSQAQQFTKLFGPGQSAPVTGIYQCQGCGFEIIRAATKLLQSRDDRTKPPHPRSCLLVRWRLLAQVEERPHLLDATPAPRRVTQRQQTDLKSSFVFEMPRGLNAASELLLSRYGASHVRPLSRGKCVRPVTATLR